VRLKTLKSAAFGLLGLLLLGQAQALRAADWPSGVPTQPADPVTDLAGMLSPSAADYLNQELRRQWQEGHFQLAILILPSLQDRPIEDLSIQVARGWALGDKQASNGVLLLVAAQDHQMRIEVGSRLEGVLPDIICRRIIGDVMAPRLRQGDNDGAITAGAAAITAVLAPQDPLAAQAPSLDSDASADAQDQDAGSSAAKALAAGGILGILLWLVGQPMLWILLIWLVLVILRRGGGFGGGGFYGGGFGGGGFGGGGFGGGGGGFGGGGGGFSGGGASGGW
jgi:uncharacterized protein